MRTNADSVVSPKKLNNRNFERNKMTYKMCFGGFRRRCMSNETGLLCTKRLYVSDEFQKKKVWMGWVGALSKFILDFWNLFNFAKPLTVMLNKGGRVINVQANIYLGDVNEQRYNDTKPLDSWHRVRSPTSHDLDPVRS